MKKNTLELLICPTCQGKLNLQADPGDPIWTGSLHCTNCQREYAVEAGIPRFIQSTQLTGLNQRLSRAYDWFSWVYRAFSRLAFALIGMKEETGRREIIDRLEPRLGRVLEVSIGPGVNLPYLVERPDAGQIYGLDISPGQLRRCQGYAHRKGWEVELFLGNGEQLPFRNESFDVSFSHWRDKLLQR